METISLLDAFSMKNVVFCVHHGFDNSIAWEHWHDTLEYMTWSTELQNRCYMCRQWTFELYTILLSSDVFKSIRSMLPGYIFLKAIVHMFIIIQKD